MGISIGHLLIVLVIVLLLFGTKKLRSIGGDLGGAIKGFRDSLGGGDKEEKPDDSKQLAQNAQNATQQPGASKESVREKDTAGH